MNSLSFLLALSPAQYLCEGDLLPLLSVKIGKLDIKYFKTCSLLQKINYVKTPFSLCNHDEHGKNVTIQGAKKIIFTACHLGKLKLSFISPDVISTSPKSFLMSRIDFTVLLLFKFLKKKHHLPVGQVKNRIH